ncbi:hypothetical protein D3C71_1532050 [compost metagenome]
MREHAGLGGNAVLLDHRVEHLQQAHDLGHVVRGGVDAYGRVTRAIHQTVQHAGRHARGSVRRVVGLQPCRQPPGQAYGVAQARGDLALARHLDQVLVAHQLGDRGHHLGREARRQRRERGAVDMVGQQPVTKATDIKTGHGSECLGIVAVDDQPRDLVGLVGHDHFLQELRQRHLGQRHLRGHALLGRTRRDFGQLIARAFGRSAGQQLRQAVEGMAAHANGLLVDGHLGQSTFSTQWIHCEHLCCQRNVRGTGS